RALRLAVISACVIGVIRFGPGLVSLPASPTTGGQQVRVMSWNLAAGQVAADLLVDRLLAAEADVVGLQELRGEHATAIEASRELAERFPNRVLEPHGTVLGMALLSRHALIEHSSSEAPPFIAASLDLGPASPPLTTITAHPLPARMALIGGLIPVQFDASQRDAALHTIRHRVEPALNDGQPVLLLGDFNVTDREPAYRDLTVGLSDAHLIAGFGPGSTWRPPAADFLPFGVLRIDYIFAGGAARPLSVSVECVPAAGDHCIVSGVIEVVER
ncbi:MAG: endonuclease/exonuclease/phosphatase family protein, partial [Chloroflexota bacterium]|nr:endonuclease/exonuclease/phosphatase family protein [Chloroflexota bacterium]